MEKRISSESLINQLGLDITKGEDVTKAQTLKQHRRAISYNVSGDYYYTTTNDGVRKQGKTKEKLADVLFDYYNNITTFKKIFEEAIEDHRKQVSERTYEDYFDTYNYYVDNELAKKNIKDITPKYIEDYIFKKCAEKHPKEKHLKRFIGLLNIIFTHAIRENEVIFNPTPRTLAPFRPTLTYDVKMAADKAYSPKEAALITDALVTVINGSKSYDKTIKAMTILFALNSGVRVGEIPSLKWEDIQGNHIHIHSQQVSRNVNGHIEYYFLNSTKDEKRYAQGGRWIDKTQNISLLLEYIKKMQAEAQLNTEYVFALSNGEWCTVRQIDNAHRTICKKLGLKLTNIHAIRMYFNSYVMVENSVADKAKYMGHSPRVNLDCYSFEDRDYVEKLGQTIDKTIPTLPDLAPTVLIA